MKKKMLIIIAIILILVVLIGIMYIVDRNRMKNNKPVIFSTWGYSYAPPIDIGENQINIAIKEFVLNNNETNNTKYQNEK